MKKDIIFRMMNIDPRIDKILSKIFRHHAKKLFIL
jgi:hypothetical protein